MECFAPEIYISQNYNFSKDKNCEIMTMTTLNKESVSKIKAKLLSYVS